MKMKVLLASNNGHKIKEIKEILGDFFDVGKPLFFSRQRFFFTGLKL